MVDRRVLSRYGHVSPTKIYRRGKNHPQNTAGKTKRSARQCSFLLRRNGSYCLGWVFGQHRGHGVEHLMGASSVLQSLAFILLFPSHPREKDVLHEKRELEAKPTALAMFMDWETTGNPRAGDRLEPLRGLLVLQPKSH